MCALGARDGWWGAATSATSRPTCSRLPALTAPKFKVEGSSAEIDARVREIVRDGLSVYRVDGEALKALEPDVIVTQDHCEVCAVSLADVEAATCTWTGRPVDDRLAEARLHRRRLRRHPPRRPRARRRRRPASALVREMQRAHRRRRARRVAGRADGRASPSSNGSSR